MGPAGVRGRRVRRGLLAVGLVLGAGSQLGFSCQPVCSAPYRPVGGDEVSVGEPPTGTWPVPATAVARPTVTGPLDTDGDGAADTTEGADEGRTLVVRRASGDLSLTVAAPALIWTDLPEQLTAGDLDGDGRDDLVVTVLTRPPEHAADQPPTVRYLVAGATADDVHPVAAVGSVLLPAGDPRRINTVGDIDGDGRDDLAAITVTGDIPRDTRVWLGADLTLSPGATEAPPSVRPPDGDFLGAVPLDGRDALVIVTHRADSEEQYHDFLVWVPEGELAFTTRGAGPVATVQPIGAGTAPAQFRVLDDPGPSGNGRDRWLTATLQNRGQTQRWAWDLDELCTNTPLAV
jgi:hypothetical protein